MFQGDMEKIEERVSQLEILLGILRREEFFQSKAASLPMRVFASERVVELLFLVFTDIAAILIDRFILRDPGSYEDMVDILAAEEILSADEGTAWKEVISTYRLLTREYRFQMEGEEEILALLTANAEIYQRFPRQARQFVASEHFPLQGDGKK